MIQPFALSSELDCYWIEHSNEIKITTQNSLGSDLIPDVIYLTPKALKNLYTFAMNIKRFKAELEA